MDENGQLDSDEQGEKGQAHFRSICIDTKLTCNEAQRDRAGFDFVVHDRISTEQTTGLDSRPAPLSCYVQVKTIKSKNDQIRLRLSSVEQIAKDPKPTFIYVFRLNSDGTWAHSSLIHILGSVLEKVLFKLRTEEAAGRFSVNNAYLYLSAERDGIDLEPTGAALRHQLQTACGDSPAAYAREKVGQLETLGYEGKPFLLKVDLKLKDTDEFLEALLGLKANVPTVVIEHIETRFGIPIRQEDLSHVSGQLSLTPVSDIKCTVTVRRNRFAEPILIEGNIIITPNFGRDGRISAFLVKDNLVSIVGKLRPEGFSLNVQCKEIQQNTVLSLHDWLRFFSLAQAFSSDNFSISVEPQGTKRLHLECPKQLVSSDEKTTVFDIENTKRLIRLSEMAGSLRNLNISFEELCSQAEHIASGYSLLLGNDNIPTLSLNLDPSSDQAMNIPEETTGLYVSYVKCDIDYIVWWASIVLRKQIKEDKMSFYSKTISFDEIRRVSATKYEDLMKELQSKVGDGVLMAREFSPPTAEKGNDISR